jgi:hypothetical protein
MRKSKIINLIALWLLATIIPGVYQDIKSGLSLILQPRTTIFWTYYVCSVIFAWGLFLRKEWARKGSLWLFGIYALWGFFGAYSLMGPSFNYVVEILGGMYPVDIVTMKCLLVALIIVNILWPIIVILFLTYPSVRILFGPKK